MVAKIDVTFNLPCRRSSAAHHTYLMPLPSFHDWLKSDQEPPQADRLATIIAQAGAAGLVELYFGDKTETCKTLSAEKKRQYFGTSEKLT